MKVVVRTKGAWVPGLSLVFGLAGLARAEVSEGERLFALKVQPLLQAKCLACHGDEPEKLKGGLDLRDRVSLLRGGEVFGDEV